MFSVWSSLVPRRSSGCVHQKATFGTASSTLCTGSQSDPSLLKKYQYVYMDTYVGGLASLVTLFCLRVATVSASYLVLQTHFNCDSKAIQDTQVHGGIQSVFVQLGEGCKAWNVRKICCHWEGNVLWWQLTCQIFKVYIEVYVLFKFMAGATLPVLPWDST